MQAFLDKINADPAKLAKFNLFIEQKQQKRAASEKFFKKFPMLRVRLTAIFSPGNKKKRNQIQLQHLVIPPPARGSDVLIPPTILC